jgi:hypothetical protein
MPGRIGALLQINEHEQPIYGPSHWLYYKTMMLIRKECHLEVGTALDLMFYRNFIQTVQPDS